MPPAFPNQPSVYGCLVVHLMVVLYGSWLPIVNIVWDNGSNVGQEEKQMEQRKVSPSLITQVVDESDEGLGMICPRCQSNHVIKGGKDNGKQIYRCKGCRRQFVIPEHKPDLGVNCPHCQNNNLVKAGSPKGKQQYKCKDCARVFILNSSHIWTEKDLAKICPECGSSHLVKRGKNNGYQVYRCKPCARLFTENISSKTDLTSDLEPDATCPHCGHHRFRKTGKNSAGTQMYTCKSCSGRFSQHTVAKFKQKALDEALGLSEYEKNIWDIRNLGIKPKVGCSDYLLTFTEISQPWLLDATKRFVWYSLSTVSPSTSRHRLRTIRRFSVFLAEQYPSLSPLGISRPLIVEYLSYLSSKALGASQRAQDIGILKTFLELCPRNGWADVSKEPLIYREDYPRQEKTLPKYIPEEVLNQLNQHLDALPPPYMRMVLVIQECGMRISELCTLRLNCLIQDTHGGWFLRYYQFKMKKEITIPISNESVAVIQEQQNYIKANLSPDFEYLFCARRPGGVKRGNKGFVKNEFTPILKTVSIKSFSDVLNWLAREKNICNLLGQVWHFHPHQFRHTVATRMINNGVPQHIVQRYLGHESPTMTMRYAQIHDQTLKEEFAKFKDRMVDVTGKVVSYESVAVEIASGFDPNSIDAQWLKKNIRAQALPNGLCGLPANQPICPYGANKCLTGPDGKGCTHFKTDTRYLDKHKEHLVRTKEIVEWAQENPGAKRAEELIKVNLPVKQNLERIVASLFESRFRATIIQK